MSLSRRTLYDEWLASRTTPCAEIIHGVRTGPVASLRLSREGLLEAGFSDGLPLDFEPDGLMAGGYDEDRAVYDSPVFTGGADEPRAVHLALDIFAASGTEVFAPQNGRIHSFKDNDNPLDYGPTVILEHRASDDLTFWALYGHLSRESLSGWVTGREVLAGERLGWLGAAHENGGWAPHLHVQIMLDLGGREGDFPGVFRRSERDHWRQICPDPGEWLGIELA